MDWIQFLENHNIHYVTQGPNTKRGEVSVKCPFCGEDDPSEHLGISLKDEAWGCHRNAMHRGKKPERLIQALTGCSAQQAKLIVKQFSLADPDNLDDALKALDAIDDIEEVPHHGPDNSLKLFVEFDDITPEGRGKRFFYYLVERGFGDPVGLAQAYGLKCATMGRWKDRIIIPIYRKGRLMAWTGRAIQTPKLAPRYLSTSSVIKEAIFNEDELAGGGDILFVCEGPFDALKLDNYGYELNARATCIFGTSITVDQIFLLKEAAKNFRKVVFMLDTDAIEQTFMANDWLPGAVIGMLPEGVKDPGEMSRQQIWQLIAKFQ